MSPRWTTSTRGIASPPSSTPRIGGEPKRRKKSSGRSAAVGCGLGGADEALGRADDHDPETVGIEETLGDPPHVVDRDGRERRGAVLEVVHAELLHLEAHQQRRKSRGGVEAQREGADEIFL